MREAIAAALLMFAFGFVVGSAVTSAILQEAEAHATPTCPPDTFAVSTPDGDFRCITNAVVAAEEE